MVRLVLIVTTIAALFGAVGCGSPPSQIASCKHYCDKQGSCTNAGSAAVASCKSSCDTMKAVFEDNDKLIETNCANAANIKQLIYDCYGDFCDTTLATNCANNAAQNKCEAK